MRPALALFLLSAVLGSAETTPATPTPAAVPAKRTQEQFIAALRAHFDGKVDPAGETCEVLVDPSFGRGIWVRHGKHTQKYPSTLLVPGDMAPEIVAEGWLNTAGGPPSTEGKVRWIEFSATWCGPCKEAMPHVQELYAKYKDKGLEIIVVTNESAKRFAPYLKEHGFTMPAAYGTEREIINGRFGVFCWPTAILVDRAGKIVYIGDPRDAGLEKVIKGMLAVNAEEGERGAESGEEVKSRK